MNIRTNSPSISQHKHYSYGGGTGSNHNLTIAQLVRIIREEHSYPLPTVPVEKKNLCLPIRFLFQNLTDILETPELPPASKLENLLTGKPSTPKEDEIIDVTTIEDPSALYDSAKAKHLMGECERHVMFARFSMNDVTGDWEDRIVRTGWTKRQKKIFKKMLKILHNDNLARLTYSGNTLEPLYRRLSIDKTARAVRCLLTDFCWDTKLTQWLHGVLVENLSIVHLSAYLDILQTLKAKIPTLIDRMIALSTTKGEVSNGSTPDKVMLNAEALNLLLKRPWDPFGPLIQSSKSKRFPVTPVFLIVPSGPGNANILCAHRQRSLISLLSGVGKVITVSLTSQSGNKLNVHEYSERIILASQKKLHQVVGSFPDKPVYIVGWGTGAIVAATISKTEKVTGVICLAFPCFGIFGSRADVDDHLYDLKTPIFFIIGDRATNATVTDMELFRKRLKCENALSVVCHADDFLRVINQHQKKLLATQSYVDKCIIDEIVWFIVNLPIFQEELRVKHVADESSTEFNESMKVAPVNNSASNRKIYNRSQIVNSIRDSNSTTTYLTASHLIQQSSNKRKLEDSLSQPQSNAKRKPSIGISPLARPDPSKSTPVTSYIVTSALSTMKSSVSLNVTPVKPPESGDKLKLNPPSQSIEISILPSSSSSGIKDSRTSTIVNNPEKCVTPIIGLTEEYTQSQILKQAIRGTIPRSIPGLPDTTAILSSHPIQAYTSNLAKQESLRSQLTPVIPRQIPHQQQVVVINTPIRGPSQHLYRPSTPRPIMTADKPLPTRCPDISPISNLSPTSTDSINPERFHTLKSTLSVSKDVPTTIAPRPVAPYLSQLSTTRLPKSQPSSLIPTTVVSTASLKPQAEVKEYPSKYSVFASKDKRVKQKYTPPQQQLSIPSGLVPSSAATTVLKSSIIVSTQPITTTTLVTQPISTTTVTLQSSSLTMSQFPLLPSSSSSTTLPSRELGKGGINSSDVATTTSITAPKLAISHPLLHDNLIDVPSTAPALVKSQKFLCVLSSPTPMDKLAANSGDGTTSLAMTKLINEAVTSSLSHVPTTNVPMISISQIPVVFNPQGLLKSKIVVNLGTQNHHQQQPLSSQSGSVTPHLNKGGQVVVFTPIPDPSAATTDNLFKELSSTNTVVAESSHPPTQTDTPKSQDEPKNVVKKITRRNVN